MEIQKNELQILKTLVEERSHPAAAELSSLDLAYVGGGIGDTVPH